MHHGNGGTGSAEHTAAVAFNGGVQRRNSITQAHEIHALQPTGAAAHVSRAQLEGVRHGGAIDANALMALVHPSTEVPWDPAMGQGRLQIRTGRNFSVPQTGGGTPFDIRIHTRDNKQAGIDATSNASVGSVVRVQEGKRAMLSEKVVSTDKTINKLDWIGASSKNHVLQNSAHIPAVLPPVATPPRSRAWEAMGQISSMAGTALWHGSGASSIVGGTRQFAQNMQSGGTWTGAGIGAARAVAGAAVMTTLATSMPVRAAASAGIAGLSGMAGMLGGRRW